MPDLPTRRSPRATPPDGPSRSSHRARRTGPDRIRATAPSRANWARLAGWMLSPRWRGRAIARTKVSRSRRASMLGALVEQGGVRSHVSRDRPMPGSCSSSASSAFFRSSPRASVSACADSLRARARPARPMRSNVSALGNTNRCAFISPLKRARMMRPSSVSNAARAAWSVAVRMSCAGTNARRSRCRTARRPGERAVRCRRASLGPDGAAVRCGAPARGGSPDAGAYRCRYKTS